MFWNRNQSVAVESSSVAIISKIEGLKNACGVLRQSCSELTSRFDRVLESQLGTTQEQQPARVREITSLANIYA